MLTLPPPLPALATAIRFLTRLPLPQTWGEVPLAQSMAAFPVAGAIIGGSQGSLLLALVALRVPPLLAAAAALAFGLLLTGALHEDGLADTADGLMGGTTKERRLEIMRDSRIGTFGAAALGLALLAKAGAFVALLALGPVQAILLLSATGAASRALMVALLWTTPMARTEGLSATAGRPTRNITLIGLAQAAGLMLVAAGFNAAFPALLLAAAVTLVLRWATLRLIGGQTGDICGAVQVLSELALLASLAATLH